MTWGGPGGRVGVCWLNKDRILLKGVIIRPLRRATSVLLQNLVLGVRFANEIIGDLPGLIRPIRLLLFGLYEIALCIESHSAFIKVLDPNVFAIHDNSVLAIHHPAKHSTVAESD